jgi:hypothetical protein
MDVSITHAQRSRVKHLYEAHGPIRHVKGIPSTLRTLEVLHEPMPNVSGRAKAYLSLGPCHRMPFHFTATSISGSFGALRGVKTLPTKPR